MFVRGPDGWIACRWKYLEKVPAPFGELAWDHVSGQLAEQGQPASTELERALAVDDLLRRAYHGPPDEAAEPQAPARSPARDRRVAARTRAGTAARARTGVTGDADPAAARDDLQTPGQDNDEPLAKVIPLGIFDPFEEAKKPW